MTLGVGMPLLDQLSNEAKFNIAFPTDSVISVSQAGYKKGSSLTSLCDIPKNCFPHTS